MCVLYVIIMITISKNRNMQCTQANCTLPSNHLSGNISPSPKAGTELPIIRKHSLIPRADFPEFAQMIKIDKTQAHDPALIGPYVIGPYVMLIHVTPLPEAVLSPGD